MKQNKTVVHMIISLVTKGGGIQMALPKLPIIAYKCTTKGPILILNQSEASHHMRPQETVLLDILDTS